MSSIDAGAGVRLRPMRDAGDDYSLLAEWRNRPHVREWWDPDHPPYTVEQGRSECGPGVRGEGADRFAFIEVEGVPVGFIQYYPWDAYAEERAGVDAPIPDGAWGLDIFIGELTALGRGAGSRAVRAVCDHLFATEGASAVAFGVELGNDRAFHAYVKAGMTPTVDYLDLDTRDGERVWCTLMVRTA